MATVMKIDENTFIEGDLLFWKCEYAKARDLFHSILTQSSITPTHSVRCYHSLGAINTKLKNYDEALDNYQEQLEIVLKSDLLEKKEIDQIKCYLSIGMTFWLKGDYHRAIDSHQQAQQILSTINPIPDIQSNLFKNLANLHAKLHQFDLSWNYFQEALKIDRLYLKEDHPKFGQTYANLGTMFDYKRDYPQAIDNLLKAREIWLKSLPIDHNHIQSLDKTIANSRFNSCFHLQSLRIHQIENQIPEPSVQLDEQILDRVQGSMFGLAVGDALGASVESQPRQYLKANPVTHMQGGGTWGLNKGQFTDDTSMALCLANSLIVHGDFVPYDQLVRYKWWYKHGYMSSTGHCFDIGISTRQSLAEFEKRQDKFAEQFNIPNEEIDYLSDRDLLQNFDVYCSEEGVAGNGALMRLAPVPLFFYRSPTIAIEYSGISGQITHGDRKAYDACRYYGALIVAALHGHSKEQLLDREFYVKHRHWFGEKELHPDIQLICEGSYQKKGGYEDQIRGKGYIISSLEAALWAFWSDENSFSRGVLAAVNLGDDTNTTAAIYGQLAGAYYGCKRIPIDWIDCLYGKIYMKRVTEWILYKGTSDIYSTQE